jgi:hypothetical protein
VLRRYLFVSGVTGAEEGAHASSTRHGLLFPLCSPCHYPTMGHTKSDRARRYAILASPMSDFMRCSFVLTCPGWRETRTLRIEPFVQDGRGSQTVEAFLLRLRCRTCGGIPSIVRLCNQQGREFVLAGPGGFLTSYSAYRQ